MRKRILLIIIIYGPLLNIYSLYTGNVDDFAQALITIAKNDSLSLQEEISNLFDQWDTNSSLQERKEKIKTTISKILQKGFDPYTIMVPKPPLYEIWGKKFVGNNVNLVYRIIDTGDFDLIDLLLQKKIDVLRVIDGTFALKQLIDLWRINQQKYEAEYIAPANKILKKIILRILNSIKNIDVEIQIPSRDINQKMDRYTLLLLFCKDCYEDAEILKLLLNKGADPFKINTKYTGRLAQHFLDPYLLSMLEDSFSNNKKFKEAATLDDKIDVVLLYETSETVPFYWAVENEVDRDIILAMLQSYKKKNNKLINGDYPVYKSLMFFVNNMDIPEECYSLYNILWDEESTEDEEIMQLISTKPYHRMIGEPPACGSE